MLGLLGPMAALCAGEPAIQKLKSGTGCPNIILGGEVGAAADATFTRFRSAPFDSLAWLRADLTGEKASEFDDKWGHAQRRPYKNYSGDISGRFIEIMAMHSRGATEVHPALKELLAEVPKLQRPGGYFCASGIIDWQKPIDYRGNDSIMLPALWGNARLLCGLVEACRAFNDPTLLATARKLGDFYVEVLPRFTDPARMAEYKGGDTYAAGYPICYFPAMEGLVKLHQITSEKKYLDTAITMAAFYKSFDHLPIDHAHGMLCNQVSLLLLYEMTKDAQYLDRVEKRWDDLVKGGYIDPAGGILEKCRITWNVDEGCALADWLRLNLELARVTGKARYWDMAERTLHNHFLQNQTPQGGFGHRDMICDKDGVVGFGSHIMESTWCCTFHGLLGFASLRDHLSARTDKALTSNFALDFTSTNAAGTVVSEIRPAAGPGEVMRQCIRLTGMPATVRVRQPRWATAVTAVDAKGKALPLVGKDDFLATTKPVSEAIFIYAGGVYAENRHCERLPDRPVAGAPCILGYGPKILATFGRTAAIPAWPATIAQLQAQGMVPFAAAMRTQDGCFVCMGANAQGQDKLIAPAKAVVAVVQWSVDVDKVQHQMAGGIGASWHSMLEDYDHGKGLTRSVDIARGSGWGGNPSTSQVAEWERIERLGEWLGMDFMRIELEQRMYEPRREVFSWDNDEMKALYRILDYCERNKVDVFLTQMWGSVMWNSYEGVAPVQSAPKNMADFAKGLGTLVEYLVKHKKYSCIKWLCLVNEPSGDWAWWLGPDRKLASLAPAFKAVREELNKCGIAVQISGPDHNNLESRAVPGGTLEEVEPYLGAYDAHSYSGPDPKAMASWTKYAHSRSKPFFVTEMGNMSFGCGGNNTGPRTYGAGLSVVETVLSGLNEGVDAFNRWSFTNRGDLDGQWQLIKTWNMTSKTFLGAAAIEPEPVPYYTFAMLTRFTAAHSAILSVTGEKTGLLLSALRSPKGNLTVIVLNQNKAGKGIAVQLKGLDKTTTLQRYMVTEAEITIPNFKLDPNRTITLSPAESTLEDSLPPSSITVYTTYNLSHSDPGIISELEGK